jgi:outer membrane lipoprotein SlyB
MQTLAGKQFVSPLAALLALLLAVIVTAGCSSSPKRPVFYPNAQLNRVGGHVAQQDIDACMQMARTAGVNVTKDGEVGRKAVSGAAIGGTSSAAYGVFRDGDVGDRALAGAAAGAAAGAVRGGIQSTEQSPIFKNFVNRCLSEKGYSVIGWQ